MASVRDRIERFSQSSTSSFNGNAVSLAKSSSVSTASSESLLSTTSSTMSTRPQAEEERSPKDKVGFLSKSFESASQQNAGNPDDFSKIGVQTAAPISSKVRDLSRNFENTKIGASSSVAKDPVQQASPVNSKLSQLSKPIESVRVSAGISNNNNGSKTPDKSASANTKVSIFSKSSGGVSKMANATTLTEPATITFAAQSPVNSEVSRLVKSFESVKATSTAAGGSASPIFSDVPSVEKKLSHISSKTFETKKMPTPLTSDSEETPPSGDKSPVELPARNKVAHLSKAFESAKTCSPAASNTPTQSVYSSRSGLNLPTTHTDAKSSSEQNQEKNNGVKSSNIVPKVHPQGMNNSSRKRPQSVDHQTPALEAKAEKEGSSKPSAISSKDGQSKKAPAETQTQPLPAPSFKKINHIPTTKERAIFCYGKQRTILAGMHVEFYRRSVDVRAIDAVAASETPSGFRTSIKELVSHLMGLVQGLPCMVGATDSVRQFAYLRVLHRWIAHNIMYDTKLLYPTSQCEPDYVLKTGMTVSSGYARLLNEMAKIAGLEMRCVYGTSKAGRYTVGDVIAPNRSNNEWNIVILDGEAYHIEPTWSAGHHKGSEYVREWNEHYFLTPAELFVLDHWPEDQKDQYLDPPISLEEYRVLPYFKTEFFLAGMMPNSTPSWNGMIDCDGQSQVELEFKIADPWRVYRPDIGVKEKGGYSERLLDFATVLWTSKNEIKVICRPPAEKGDYILRLFVCRKDEETLSPAIDYLLRVQSASPRKPVKFPRVFATEKLKLLEPLNGKLSVGSKVRFRHQLVQSDKQQDHEIVVILPGNDWISLSSKLQDDGSIMSEEEVMIPKPGKISLGIQLPGKNSARIFAEYHAT